MRKLVWTTAFVAVVILAAGVHAQNFGPVDKQIRLEDAEAAWMREAQSVAGRLGLSGAERARLAAAFAACRARFDAGVEARTEELMANIAPDNTSAGMLVARNARIAVGREKRTELGEALGKFLDAERVKRAVELLGSFHNRWDFMVKTIADFELGDGQAKALEVVNDYVVDSIESTAAAVQRDPNLMKLIDDEGQLKVAMETALKAILSTPQMWDWMSLVERSGTDDERSIDDPRVQHRSYRMKQAGGQKIPYALFLPSTYDGSKAYPLIVALHGLGRTYDWLMGYEGYLDFAERDGYILVTPLGYIRHGWYGSVNLGRAGELSELDVMNVLGIVRNEFSIDASRIYLWGHSMGGAGTYRLAEKHPKLWAGLGLAAPAPLGGPKGLETYKHIPTIAFQGTRDGLVGPTRIWVARMKELGMEHVYVEVPGGDHSFFISRNRETLSKLFSFFNIVNKKGRGNVVYEKGRGKTTYEKGRGKTRD